MSATYTNTRESLVQMFLDATVGESFNNGRLVTRESGENTVVLISYGWNKIAEYNEATDTVTVFFGHSQNVSKTLTEHVNLVQEMASNREGRIVNTLSDAAPNVARPPAESAQFIDNYKSFSGSDSPVESWASETVDAVISEAASRLL